LSEFFRESDILAGIGNSIRSPAGQVSEKTKEIVVRSFDPSSIALPCGGICQEICRTILASEEKRKSQ
jgi:hypothetical protein